MRGTRKCTPSSPATACSTMSAERPRARLWLRRGRLCGAAAPQGRATDLCEAAPNLRERLKSAWRTSARSRCCRRRTLRCCRTAAFDVVIMHSVSQYLSPDELDRLLALFRRLLRPGGKLVIGDVVQPDIPAWKDALALAVRMAGGIFCRRARRIVPDRVLGLLEAAQGRRPHPLYRTRNGRKD